MKMDNLSVFMMGHNWTESVFISKLHIPSTSINTEKELLIKNELVSGRHAKAERTYSVARIFFTFYKQNNNLEKILATAFEMAIP